MSTPHTDDVDQADTESTPPTDAAEIEETAAPTAASAPDVVPGTPPESNTGSSLVEAAAADAAVDLSRTDTTNTTLSTLAGVLLTILVAGAGLTTGDGSYPTAALVAMGAASALLAAVLVVLTTAMWPRRGGTGGVPHYATLTPAQVVDELATTDSAHWHAERAVAKATIASRKHTAQRLAGACLAAAGVLLAVATIWTLAT
ncbi:hypothetical protein [Nocardiopsis sp. NPDC006938]|uniref:hypothetical protein n=1 Tax=Nocardiopsis sp. NPDC006938 TaxID=3364337 RepID=UPI0036925569